MRVSSITGRVRAFTKEDIPQVADLHRRVFRVADHTSQELLDSYRTYFTQDFLEDPWRDYDAESLVHEEDHREARQVLSDAGLAHELRADD